ncbi:hypothetical protein [Chryseobacterium sp. FH1]|uniref:hypothetical protein n=1 Tax=Chryseobacterium sp. FH1 TaxID=1233951 RepID=UPI0006892B9F|nr:hypothetical protein [Chryseobacterium sp. FH1]
MTDNLTIERYGQDAVVSTPVAVFSYEVEKNVVDPRDTNFTPRQDSPYLYSEAFQFSDNLQILPYGDRNDMPTLLRDVVSANPNILGVFEKKQGLLWGGGPLLYKEQFVKVDNKSVRVREWQENKQIQDWLDSWDYLDYLLATITDFNFIQGSFSKFRRENSINSSGKKFIHSLEHLNPAWTRLAKKVNVQKPTHAIFTEFWQNQNALDYQIYDLFNMSDPFAKPNSVMFSRTMTFATDFYAIPTIYGALEWIRRSTAIPLILKALSKNSINAKYHVTSPAKFWDDKRKQLEEKAEAEGKDYDERDLIAYERELFKTIMSTLSSDDNVGKIWHTKNLLIVDGMNILEQGWSIKPIDQNIKDFVATQISIGNKADSAVSAALGIHKSIAGISSEGSADSGSEQLYAYLMYKLIGVDIPEYIVTKAINAAIKANFPNIDLKLGFYHEEAQRQEDQSSKDRVKNNVA